MVSCQKGPTRHAHAWQIGPFWQDTLDVYWYSGQFKLPHSVMKSRSNLGETLPRCKRTGCRAIQMTRAASRHRLLGWGALRMRTTAIRWRFFRQGALLIKMAATGCLSMRSTAGDGCHKLPAVGTSCTSETNGYHKVRVVPMSFTTDNDCHKVQDEWLSSIAGKWQLQEGVGHMRSTAHQWWLQPRACCIQMRSTATINSCHEVWIVWISRHCW